MTFWVTFALLTTKVHAAPFVPASDLTILERLSTTPGESARLNQSTRAMRATLARDPKNVDLAVRMAQQYVSRSRSESDPRLLGQAQAALGVWWSQAEPPVPVLLLRATIRQSLHDFSNALRDLDQAVRREPGNAQAWLTLATVQQVTGNLPGAADSCRKVAPLAPPLIGITCLASIDGSQGRAAKAYDALNNAMVASGATGRDSGGVRGWALTLQAELAERLARPADAERLYLASLAIDATDAYTVAAYADFLIDAGRAADVLKLIPADTRGDVLLLRRAIAAKLAGAADAAQLAQELGQRFNASRARGDRVHLREEARFELAVKSDPINSLALARDNWVVQKEPLDARIALEAAIAARQPKAVADVLAWIESTQLQGEKLAQLAAQAKAQ
ncbi:MAG: hypothetical protein H7203_05550 [Rhizobacter sp.]|nr:hypothetical protein [Burkholderiales bacterium]